MKTRRYSDPRAITEGVIWKQLLLFFFPIVIGTFFQQLYNTVDAVIVGNVVGKEALAAVGGTTATLVNLLVGFFIGLASGATVIISQFYGAGEERKVSLAVHTASALALIFGLLLTVFGMLFAPQLLRFMSTPPDVLPHAAVYLRVVFGGMVPLVIYNVGAGILRAIGDSKRPLYYLIAACLTNIVLDILFVAVLRWGTAGAALATVFSQCVCAALIVVALVREKGCVHLVPRNIRLHGRILADIVRIGFPAGLQSVMYSLSNATIQAAVNGFPTDILAGWTAYGKMDGLYWMVVSSFGIAITTFAGQNWGADRVDRVRGAIRQCLLMTLAATLLMSALMLTFGHSLFRLFTQDEGVIVKGVGILRLLVPFFATYIPVEIFSGALRGTGDSVVPTLLTLFGVCLLRVVWIFAVVPHHHTIGTVLASYPITWILTSSLFVLYYFTRSPIMRRARLLQRAKE